MVRYFAAAILNAPVILAIATTCAVKGCGEYRAYQQTRATIQVETPEPAQTLEGIASIGTEQVRAAPAYVQLLDATGQPYITHFFENQNALDTFTNEYLPELLPHWKQTYGNTYQWAREDVQDIADKADAENNQIITEQEIRAKLARIITLRQGHSQQIMDTLGQIR